MELGKLDNYFGQELKDYFNAFPDENRFVIRINPVVFKNLFKENIEKDEMLNLTLFHDYRKIELNVMSDASQLPGSPLFFGVIN